MTLLASAFLFDLDGVLADSTASVFRSWTTWAHRVGLEPTELLPKVHGRRAIDTIRAVRPEVDAQAELDFLIGLETTDNHDVVPIPGARELLSALPLDAWAVVTSGIEAVAIHARFHWLGHNRDLLSIIGSVAQIEIVVSIAAISLPTGDVSRNRFGDDR